MISLRTKDKSLYHSGVFLNTLRVGVLMGGRGSEREVSFNSGRTICDHLDTFRYTIIPLFQRHDGTLYLLPWKFLHRGKTTDFEHRLDAEAEKIFWDSLKERIDFMYTSAHGRYAEDGSLQGFLEVLGIPYLGSKVFASALGMDKIMQKKFLRASQIEVPRDVTVWPYELKAYTDTPETLYRLVSTIGYPCVVKPQKEGSSIGIRVVQSQKDLLEAVIHAAHVDGHKDQGVLIEEFIEGMEFSCITIRTDKGTIQPLTPTEIVCDSSTKFFDYEQKYMPGKSTKFTPARCTPECIKKIQDTAIAVTKALHFRTISRIDGFVTKDGRIIITDPNSLAGMAPSSFVFRQAAEHNLSHTDFINHLIETELSQYGILSKLLQHERTQRATMNQHTKKRIGVLLGGRNHEKEVSLDSGRNILYKLSPQKYEPVALFVSKELELYHIDKNLLVRNSTKEIELGLLPHMKVAWNDLPNLVDFVFIGLHGDVGENGSVQGTLEMLGLPYNGSSVLTSALCMDKYETGQFLKSQGFDVPLQYLVDKNDWEASPVKVLNSLDALYGNSSVIIKPHDDGCSVMVAKADTHDKKTQALKAIFQDGKSHALVENLIKGMELTVGVMGNQIPRALPPSQAKSVHAVLSMEEKFLPGAGENQTPAPLPPQALAFVRKTIEDVYKTLDCKGYARIDCFYQPAKDAEPERLIILEINSLPALTPATCIFHQAAEIGLHPMEFIDLLIEFGYEEHSRRGIVVATDTSKHSSATSIAMNPPALESLS
jgi:D-alanine--D-alanine ligase